MAGLSEAGQLTDDEASDLNSRVERFLAAWKPDGSTALEWFLPPPGARHRALALVRIITADMERRAEAKLPFRVERYVNDFPDELSTNAVPAPLLAVEYQLRHKYTDKPQLAEYQRWFPDQFDELQKLLAQQAPVATATGERTAQTPIAPVVLPTGGLHLSTINDGRPVTPASGPRPKQMKPEADPNRSGMPSDMLPGDAQYQLIRRIGSGAFGEVFEARAPGGVKVAIKRILRTVDHPASKGEFEALQAIKELSHPFLLKTNAYWVFDDRLVIVMDLADGNLADRIAHHQQLGLPGVPPEELIPLFEQAGEALDYLHSQDVSHRDVKPENILIQKGYAKVGDFGLARLQEHTMTAVPNTVGTPAYMAPEMWRLQVSLHSDQYALAATYVRSRLGRHLFETNVLVDMANSHLNETPNLDPLSPEEQAVLLKALSKNPRDRYPSCLAFAKALRAAVFPPPPPEQVVVEVEKPVGGGRGTLGTLAIAITAALVVGAIVVGALMYLMPRTDQSSTKPEEKKEEKKEPPTEPKEPLAQPPKDWFGVADKGTKVLGDKRYYNRITRNVGGEQLDAVLIYPKNAQGLKDPFYMTEHKLTNRVFTAVWNWSEVKQRAGGIKTRQPTFMPDLWQQDEKGKPLDIDGKDAELPVSAVTFPQAYLVAEALRGQLPTYDQWVKATGVWEDGREEGPTSKAVSMPPQFGPPPRPPEKEKEYAAWKKAQFHDKQLALGLERPLPVRAEAASGDKSYWQVYQLVSNGQEWLGDNANKVRFSITPLPDSSAKGFVVGRKATDVTIGSFESLRDSDIRQEYAWDNKRYEEIDGGKVLKDDPGSYSGFRVVFELK